MCPLVHWVGVSMLRSEQLYHIMHVKTYYSQHCYVNVCVCVCVCVCVHACVHVCVSVCVCVCVMCAFKGWFTEDKKGVENLCLPCLGLPSYLMHLFLRETFNELIQTLLFRLVEL